MQLTQDISFCNPPELEPINHRDCLAASTDSAGCTCVGCEKIFTPKNDQQKYCSKQCAKNASKRRSTARQAKHENFLCPICGKSGTRRLKCGKSVVTCGHPSCVNAHKLLLRQKQNEHYRKTGIKYTWPSQKKQTCLCGNTIRSNASTCFKCRQVIQKAKKYAFNIPVKAEHLLCKMTCKRCSKLYTPTKIDQIYCSRSCCSWVKNRKFKAARSVRRHIMHTLRKFHLKKVNKTFDVLGYSVLDLVVHLESHFVFGMTWDNYGEWHIDHVRPVSHFSIKHQDDVAKVWALTNLKPRWATNTISKMYGFFMVGNIEKGNRFVG